MEMYFFNKSTLQKFLTIYCNKGDSPTEEIMATVSRVLQELYLFRLANKALGWGMAFLDSQTCMTVTGWSIDFDATDFVASYINKNSKMSSAEEFSKCVSSFREKLTADARNQSHGHDFVEILCWFLRQKGA